MNTIIPIIAAATLAASAAQAASADVVVPPGFEVDVEPLADGYQSRVEAVRSAQYGSGVMVAWIWNGSLFVRQVFGDGGADCVLPGFDRTDSVWDVRFDTTGLFGTKLFVSVGNAGAGTRARLYVVDPSCTIEPAGSVGGNQNELVFSLDFTTGANGYLPGAYLEDIDGAGPPFPSTALWHATWNQGMFDLVELASNLLPAGRTDIDAWIEFDRTPAATYGGQLLVCDCDAADDDMSALYALRPDLTFDLLTDEVATSTRCLKDLAISTGGAFGETVYTADSATDEVKVGTTLATFASGFGGIRSLSVSESGDELFVVDAANVYRIRRLPTETICPDDPNDYFRQFGGAVTGDALDLCASDDVRLEVLQSARLSPLLPFIRLEYWAHSSLADNPITSVTYTIEGHVSALVAGGQNPDTLRTSIRNYATGLFEVIDQRGTAANADETISHVQAVNAPDYVNAGDGEVRVRQDVLDPGNVFSPNWFLKVDLFEVMVGK